MPSPTPTQASLRWQSFKAASVRGFHAYAGWLVGISWKRFVLLALALLIGSAITQDLPFFRYSYTETVSDAGPKAPPAPPTPPAPPSASEDTRKRPLVKVERPKAGSKTDGVQILIDESGIVIKPKPAAAAASAGLAEAAKAGTTAIGAAATTIGAAASAASGVAGPPAAGAASPASAVSAGARAGAADDPVVEIRLPEGATSETVREAVAEARQAIQEALRDAHRDAADAARDVAQAQRDVAQAKQDALEAARSAIDALHPAERTTTRVRQVRLLNGLPELALLWILGSAIIKVTYKQQIQAQAKAAEAVETAEAESLKRQVVEARMAAMQAQVEPHFLFNTLASIDHLIQVDPARASVMQKNLIALLRASMPTMREAGDGGARDLGREVAVIRPYLEILKVRMEERLDTALDVPDGLLSAEFPGMMLQTLVENAIKHGLEPKPEGGHLHVKAEIMHGKLVVSVSDSGLGFGRAATAGTGVGLANIRERLRLLYGAKGQLAITENPGGGTVATLTMPYRPLSGESAS